MSVRVTIVSYVAKVMDVALQASRDAVRHGAAKVRQVAIASITPSPLASSPGRPPHTRGSMALPRSILFATDEAEAEAIVGPSATMVGRSARRHEIGGLFAGQYFERRPFMAPALDKSLDTFAGDFAGSFTD